MVQGTAMGQGPWVRGDVSFQIWQQLWENEVARAASKVCLPLQRFMQGVNHNSQLQEALVLCSCTQHPTSAPVTYLWILPSSVHKPQDRAIKTIFMLCSFSLWALRGLGWGLIFLSLPSNLAVHQIQQMWKENHNTAASHRLLMSI